MIQMNARFTEAARDTKTPRYLRSMSLLRSACFCGLVFGAGLAYTALGQEATPQETTGQEMPAMPTPEAVFGSGLEPQGAGSAAPGEQATSTAGDPPSRVLRAGVLEGKVSLEPAGVNSFTPAELNSVLTTGDRVYADGGSGAELQAGSFAVRLGAATDLTVSAMTDTLAQFGVAAGSVHLRTYAVDPGTVLEMDTPEAAVTILQPGDLRVDADPASHATTITLVSGGAQVDAPGYSQVLAPGQRVRVYAANAETGAAAYTESLPPAASDRLDAFSDTRDGAQASGADLAGAYVNPDTVGSADLGAYGAWNTSDFGPVWFPVVAADWRPYCFGHWRWVSPWGWTWVGAEPWGFAPFHYGRWASIAGRWGWIPGPRAVRPVYAPAMVVFAGGLQFEAALGNTATSGVAAWFPLGPREPLFPWYTGSTLYTNRLNISNLYNPNTAEVRGLYNQRAVNVFANGTPSSRTYANRSLDTVAVPASVFASGKPVGAGALHVTADALANAAVLTHPAVVPERSMVVPRPTAAVPASFARPVLASRSVAGAGESPNAAPNRPAEVDGVTGVTGVVLQHRAAPPAPSPSFDRQREAMVITGRPLSPAQIEALREAHPRAPGTSLHPAPGRPAPASPPPASSASPAAASHFH